MEEAKELMRVRAGVPKEGTGERQVQKCFPLDESISRNHAAFLARGIQPFA
ncbi:hypothetical protein [Planctomicrobium sp. SH527]|uniref:hypothetical protein n=1 Tax=Planctomicrobium sp. SH527 TaxID=3448123 RepID=UPI003F5B80D4